MTLTTAQTIWRQVLEELKEVFDPKIFKAHLMRSEVMSLDETAWTIGVVSAYSAEELTKKYKGNIIGFISDHDENIEDVLFVDKNDFSNNGVKKSVAKEQVVTSAPIVAIPPVADPVVVVVEEPVVEIEEISVKKDVNHHKATKKAVVGNGPLYVDLSNEDVYAETTISLDDVRGHKDLPRSSGISSATGGQGSIYTGLNPNNVFESFVVGSSNRVAFAAAQAVAESPGKAYNPLFIYGGVGVGKTHIMQAVGNAIVAKFPHMKVQYFTSERFTNDFVGSLRDRTTDKFRAQYRALDILLIDDIQFIAGKDSTQEEFFHTFNEVVGKGGHILMTSDRSPEDIGQLEERLVSRFKGGMLVDIGLPDYEMRELIIRTKCQEMGLPIPNESVAFLASHIQSNTRELQGTFLSIVSKIRTNALTFSLEDVKRAWGEDVTSGPSLASKNVNTSKVIQVVHHHFNIRKADLLGKVRTKNFVVPRQICMYLLKTELDVPYEKIGELLGGRDHTTIMHGVSQIQEQLSTNDQIRKEIMLIKESLTG